jgi:hypothetical protein
VSTSDRYDYVRLGAYMLNRREGQGLSQDAIAVLGGPSDTTIGALERGTHTGGIRSATWRKIDLAYGWRPGGALAVARGEEPELVDGWPVDLVRSLRNAIVHDAPEAAGIGATDRKRILALALRFEQAAVDEIAGIAGIPDSARHARREVYDEIVERHRQAILDQIEVLRAELHHVSAAREAPDADA